MSPAHPTVPTSEKERAVHRDQVDRVRESLRAGGRLRAPRVRRAKPSAKR